MRSQRLLVAIHDVPPAHADRVARVLDLLDSLGVHRPALFVVPDWHGEWPLGAYPEFVAELRRRQENGAEVFLHGYRHDEAGHRRSLAERVRVFGRTAGSAEFMMLSREETAERLDRGRQELRTLGLDPIGFVPPAWLFAPHTRALVRERGLALTESFGWIECLQTGRRVFAPALSWSTARPWRSRVTAWLARVRTAVEGSRALVRVAIHPRDVEISPVCASLEHALCELLEVRTPRGYQDLVRDWDRRAIRY